MYVTGNKMSMKENTNCEQYTHLITCVQNLWNDVSISARAELKHPAAVDVKLQHLPPPPSGQSRLPGLLAFPVIFQDSEYVVL
jgi:hypothetical protein